VELRAHYLFFEKASHPGFNYPPSSKAQADFIFLKSHDTPWVSPPLGITGI